MCVCVYDVGRQTCVFLRMNPLRGGPLLVTKQQQKVVTIMTSQDESKGTALIFAQQGFILLRNACRLHASQGHERFWLLSSGLSLLGFVCMRVLLGLCVGSSF